MSDVQKLAPNSWTTIADIKRQILTWWQRGEILCELTEEEKTFPRRLKFKTPTSSEISSQFDNVRVWIASIASTTDFRIEMREVNHTVFGKNSLPAEAWIDSVDQAIALIGKKKESSQYMRIFDMTHIKESKLTEWVKKNPLRSLELYHEWSRLLDVVDWFKNHPDSAIYVRQIDIPGVHTKFIESHREVLSQLLDIVLPPQAIRHSKNGIKNFAQRYNLLDKPTRIRFRILDAEVPVIVASPYHPGQEMTLDASSFFSLHPKVRYVFITENEINFLAFPELKHSMIIFGGGYGLSTILEANWLMHCKVFYWGDLDTHGFAILSEARKSLPHLHSLLMDEQTLVQHLDRRAEDVQHKAESLAHLTDAEQRVYRDLRNNTWGVNVRIEQELIGWKFACEKILKAIEQDDLIAVASPAEPEDLAPLRLSAYDLKDYLSPSKCGLRVFFKINNHAESNESEFLKLKKTLARKHITKTLNQLIAAMDALDVVDLRGFTQEDGIVATEKAIKDRASIIISPVLNVSTRLSENDCQIEGVAHALILKESQYVVKNITSTLKSNVDDGSEIVLKTQLFGWQFAKLFGYEPLLELYCGDSQTVTVDSDGGRAALRLLHEILEFKQLPKPPYSPVGNAKCAFCEYKDDCWASAEASRDVSTLVGVDQDLAIDLHKAGVRTIDSLFSDFNVHRLAAFQVTSGPRIITVGKKAALILKMAEAKLLNKALILERIELPVMRNFVVIDFEGTPPHLTDKGMVYLWGSKVFSSNSTISEYSPIVQKFEPDADLNTWKAFLTHCSNIFATLGDISFMHWHHYERTQITAYIERYGDLDGTAARIIANLMDLHELVKNSVALPLSSYSLKSVEKFIGFQRSQSDYGGVWSLTKFIEARDETDAVTRAEIMEVIQTYNREDLEATHAIYQWLQSLQEDIHAMD